jgi:threonine dehydrogenase-like Zn-dependent dehydrogenase
MYGPGDVRVEERKTPQIIEPTDAIIRVSAACVCGSDLWPYRGVEEYAWPAPMGHEYAGIVEEIGDAVTTIEPGQFVVGSFWGDRQHLRDLPGRLPERLREPRADGHARRPGRAAACSAR